MDFKISELKLQLSLKFCWFDSHNTVSVYLVHQQSEFKQIKQILIKERTPDYFEQWVTSLLLIIIFDFTDFLEWAIPHELIKSYKKRSFFPYARSFLEIFFIMSHKLSNKTGWTHF